MSVEPLRVGLDIGGTKMHGVVLGRDGAVVASVRAPSRFGPEAVVGAAREVLAGLAESCGIAPTGFESVGVGIPGAVDPASGTVRQALNLGIDELALGRALRDPLGFEPRVENDVNAAAIGAAEGVAGSLAYLNLGTGLAAGVVVDGRLWRGARGAAGEIGHIPIDPEGPVCGCGMRGCLETMASGSGIQRQWGASPAPDAAEFLVLAEAGDARAVVIRDRLLAAVAAAVRILVLTVDADRVVLGGGIASALDGQLLDGVRRRLRAWEEGSVFLDSLDLAERVELATRDRPIAAIGAALAGGERE